MSTNSSMSKVAAIPRTSRRIVAPRRPAAAPVAADASQRSAALDALPLDVLYGGKDARDNTIWRVPSRTVAGKMYAVKVSPLGQVICCECDGARFRAVCSHQSRVQDLLRATAPITGKREVHAGRTVYAVRNAKGQFASMRYDDGSRVYVTFSGIGGATYYRALNPVLADAEIAMVPAGRWDGISFIDVDGATRMVVRE